MKSISKTVLILLVPCLTSAQIQVEIVPGSNDRIPKVVVSGTDRTKTSDIDLQAFQVTESSVKENLARLELIWKKVGEVNINHASAFGYKDLFITLKPKYGRILRSNDKIIKPNKVIIRNQGTRSRPSKPILRHEVTETMTTKWFDAQDISVGSDIKHNVGFNRLEHSSKYGHEDFASRTVDVEAEAEDEVILQPGQSVKAQLQVKETTLEVRIDYEVSLDGDIHFGYLCTSLLVHYCAKHSNLDINDYLRRIDQSPVLKPYEVVTFTYYHDPQVKFGEINENPEPAQNSDTRPGTSIQYKFISLDPEQMKEISY